MLWLPSSPPPRRAPTPEGRATHSGGHGRARWWRPLHFAAIVLGSALLSWAAWKSGQPAWSGLDRLGWDFAFRARGPIAPQAVAALPQTRDIVCVRSSHLLPRRLLARLVRKLKLARAVGLDFMLVDNLAGLEPDERRLYLPDIRRWKDEDAPLARAIRDNGHVLLALWPEDARAQAAPASKSSVLNSTGSAQDSPSKPEEPGGEAQNLEWRKPSPLLAGAARGLGHVVITQEGGVLRRVPLWQQTTEGRVPCLGLALAALASGQSAQQFERGKSWRLEGGSATIDWLGGRSTFEQLDNSIGYEQALEWEPEDFKGKIVLVGEVSRESKEIVLTPWGEAPAMQAHATIAAMLLAPNGPPAPPPSTWVLGLCLLSSGLVLAPLWRLGLWGSFASLLAGCALTVAAVAWLFTSRHVLLPGSAPIAAGVIAFNGLALYEYRRARHTLSRFIGPEMIARALHPLSTLEPGEGEGREEEATAFFCDLRGYSTLSEVLSPRQVALLVNAYTTLLLRATHAWGGRVIDYQGDGIFVIFETLPEKSWRGVGPASALPEDGARHATRAVRAALEVRQGMAEFNALWRPTVGRDLDVGIGLQSGLMQIGIIGTSDRVHFAALGDAVNVAARLQEFSKTLGAHIILGQGTHGALEREGSRPTARGGEFELLSFGVQPIRGRAREMQVWGVREPGTEGAST